MKPWQNILFGCLLSLFVIGGIFLISQPPRGKIIALKPLPTQSPLVVHVIGAVLHPGVYNLPLESRVVDAVEAAGGFNQSADMENTNLAAKIFDGQKIIIPVKSTTLNQLNPGSKPASPIITSELNAERVLININTASKELLETLPGIGSVRAGQIIAYRTEKGPFKAIEDLLDVPGIAQVTYNQIKQLISTQ